MPPKTNIIVYVKRREKKAHTEKWPNSGNKNLDKNDPNGKTTVEIVVFSSIMQIKILCNFILRCDRWYFLWFFFFAFVGSYGAFSTRSLLLFVCSFFFVWRLY